MDLRRTSRALALLRRHGVVHYRDADLEISFGAPPATVTPAATSHAGGLTLVDPEPRRETDIEAALHPHKYDPDDSEEENVA